ncbi:MAG TPA: hypothetical protein VOB72_11145 [Candidatus Dormibacteraeota bacterium]|nr:hypothetical protein [Candidatus Dormibacteraeota bacterium]
MRLVVHRGQALLLLVVGGLTGAIVAGAVLERNGQPPPVATRAAELLAPSRSQLPARIQIGSPSQPPSDGAVVAAREAGPSTAIADDGPASGPNAPAIAPSPTTTVVPATVYAYPPDDHTRGGAGGGGGGGPGPDGGGSSGSGQTGRG